MRQLRNRVASLETKARPPSLHIVICRGNRGRTLSPNMGGSGLVVLMI